MKILSNCIECLRSEFKLRNLYFEHNEIEDFYQSQWQTGERSLIYLIYRWVWALFFIGLFTSVLVLQFSDGKIFIFLTNWGLIACVVSQLLAVILVTRWHFNFDGIRDEGMKYGLRTPSLVKFYWLMHTIAMPLALVITTVYWTFLHGKMNKPMRFPVISFSTHCLNSVFMVIDFFVIAFPVRILHILYSMLYPTLFFFFTLIYFFCNGTDEYGYRYVYPILDWTTPARPIITFAGTVTLYIIFTVILFMIFRLKRSLHRTLRTMRGPHVVGLY